MKKKKYILRSLWIGTILFVFTRVIAFFCIKFVMILVPTGSHWTPVRGLLTSFCNLVLLFCSPFWRLFVALTENVQLPLFLYQNPVAIRSIVDFLWWMGIAFLIQYIRLRKSLSVLK